MDASRFDAWTRRRFGLVVGGGTASLLGLSVLGDAEAKKKHKHKKKKKCKKLKASCGGKKKCCKSLSCGESVAIPEGTHCCRQAQGACTDATECCAPSLCNVGAGVCCILNGEGPCTADADCCDDNNVCDDATKLCVIPPSDRALKSNFGSVDPADMLARVRELPISTWNYRSDDAAVRHIGPMAQDFSAAFGVGADDRHIHPADGQGVALAAIQGLAAQLRKLEEENTRLAARVALLEGRD